MHRKFCMSRRTRKVRPQRFLEFSRTNIKTNGYVYVSFSRSIFHNVQIIVICRVVLNQRKTANAPNTRETEIRAFLPTKLYFCVRHRIPYYFTINEYSVILVSSRVGRVSSRSITFVLQNPLYNVHCSRINMCF